MTYILYNCSDITLIYHISVIHNEHGIKINLCTVGQLNNILEQQCSWLDMHKVSYTLYGDAWSQTHPESYFSPENDPLRLPLQSLRYGMVNVRTLLSTTRLWKKMADVEQPLVSTARLQGTIACPRPAHPPRDHLTATSELIFRQLQGST